MFQCTNVAVGYILCIGEHTLHGLYTKSGKVQNKFS